MQRRPAKLTMQFPGGSDGHPGDQLRPRSRARPGHLPPMDESQMIHPHEPLPTTVGLNRPKMDKPRTRPSNSGHSLVAEAQQLSRESARQAQRTPGDATLHFPHIDNKGTTGQRKKLPTIEEVLPHEAKDTKSFQLPSLTGKGPSPPEAAKVGIPRVKTYAHNHTMPGPSAQAHSHNMTGLSTQAQSYTVIGQSAKAQSYSMTGPLAQAQSYSMTGPAAQAQSYSNTGPSAQAQSYSNTGPSTQALSYTMTGTSAQMQSHIPTGPSGPAPAGRRFKHMMHASQTVPTGLQPVPPPMRPADYVPAPPKTNRVVSPSIRPSDHVPSPPKVSPDARISDHMTSGTHERIILSPHDLRMTSPASTASRHGGSHTTLNYEIIRSPTSLMDIPISGHNVQEKRKSPPTLIDVNMQPSCHSIVPSAPSTPAPTDKRVKKRRGSRC